MDRMTRGSIKNIGDNWKEIKTNGRKKKERTNEEEEEEEIEERRIEEWNKEDKMGKIEDPYDGL